MINVLDTYISNIYAKPYYQLSHMKISSSLPDLQDIQMVNVGAAEEKIEA